MINLLLKLISWFLRKILYYPFFWYGCFRSYHEGGLDGFYDYWKQSAISDDVDLNVVGQYAINDLMHTGGPKAGNRLQTISCWLGLTSPNKKVNWWVIWLSRKDKNHCAKAVKLHREAIKKEFLELTFKT